MNKNIFIIIALFFTLMTINSCTSHEVDNITLDNKNYTKDFQILSISNNTELLEEQTINTQITVESTSNFDVVGDYFKVKLSDANSNVINNAKVTFTINGIKYSRNTDSSGIASLQLNLIDGNYKIASNFAGDTKYSSSSLISDISINNTRVVNEGLSNEEIQSIIDSSKDKNIILFNGESYANINLIINKRLTLISTLNTQLKSNSTNPVILITSKSSSNTVVNGFNIQGNGNGIEVINSDYVVICNNNITTQNIGIFVQNAKYINITGNNILQNSKSGIKFISVSDSHIYSNNINKNCDGIGLADSNAIYIYNNEILSNKLDGILISDRDNVSNSACENIHITYNTVKNNGVNGINVDNAGDDIKIASNDMSSNSETGLLISKIGSNSIQSNVITNNAVNGIKFAQNYVQPDKQYINYNVIYDNSYKDVDAKDTYYQENGHRLELGDNWYGDWGFVCYKIKTSNLLFKVSQVGKNQFKAAFYDSKGNIASLLPDRTLTYNSNGQTLSITVKGGIATFTVNGADGDLISSIVDKSKRDNTFDASMITTAEVINGNSPSYSYPSIKYESNYIMSDDSNSDSGSGNSSGSGSGLNSGNSQKNSGTHGNSTLSQNQNPSSNPSKPINSASQNYQSYESSVSSQSSESGGGSDSQPQSVVKQIIIDEDDFFKLTGISFIVLIMILTIGAYYRDDIKEMNSKR